MIQLVNISVIAFNGYKKDLECHLTQAPADHPKALLI